MMPLGWRLRRATIRRRTIVATFAAALALAITLSAPAASTPEAPGGGDGTATELNGEIVLGATFPLSGSLEMYGQSAYYGAVTRIRMINESGGVNGKRLVLEWRDNRSDPSQAIRDVEELVRTHKVPAILGPLLSDATMAVGDMAKRLGVVIMTPMATMDAANRHNPWIFRACFSNSAQAEGLIAFQINSYGAQRCGILYDPRHDVSLELAEIFEKRFIEQGGKVVGSLPMVDANGAVNPDEALGALVAKKPDFLFVPCYALEAIEIVQAVKRLGIVTRLCGSDTWDNELVFDGSGSRLAGTAFSSALFEQGLNYRPFQTFFTAMEQAGMDNPDAQAACAYDAVTLLATALKMGETPEAIRKGLVVRRLPLATGRITITKDGETRKQVLVRIIERKNDRLVPVFASRYDP